MAWQFLQSAQGVKTTNSSSFGIAFATANIKLGNRIFVIVNITTSTVSTVTDTPGNTYQLALGPVTLSTNHKLYIYTAVITAGGGTKPTVTTATAGNCKFAIHLLEYAGLTTSTTDYLDGTATLAQTATTTTISCGPTSAAPGASNELCISAYGDNAKNCTVVPTGGWQQRGTTIQNTTVQGAVSDQNSVSGTGATGNWTIGNSTPPEALAVAVFKLAPVPTTSPRPPLRSAHRWRGPQRGRSRSRSAPRKRPYGVPITGFKIWWADGSMSSGTTLAHWNALSSRTDAQVVMLYEAADAAVGIPYRRALMGTNYYYCWDEDGPTYDQSDNAMQGTAIAGSQISEAEFNAIVATAMADMNRP